MVDVLLINPPSPNESLIIRDLNRSGRTTREKIIWPQTNLAYLAAMLPKNLSVEILDCIAERMNWEDFEKLLFQKKPKYVISHVITSTYKNDFKVFKLAKKINAKTITMGPHATELIKESFEECQELDFIMLKEVELTFKELILALEKDGNVGDIKGLAYRENGEIKINEDRNFIENLDELPIPRHDLLPLEKYVFPFIASKFTFVISSRGCPYDCTFCRQPIMWSKKFRSRSAESIMKELRFLKKIGVNNFLFQSDTFTIDRDVVLELCKKIIEEELNMNWGCNSRVDTIDEELLKYMKKAGCWMVAYGFESGSQKILDKCKKQATIKQIEDAANLTHKMRIKMYGYFIIGLPGETKKTIEETINLSKKLPLTFAIFHVASPYPGTEFHYEAGKNNWLNLASLEDIDQGGVSPVNYQNLSSEEIMRGIKKAYLSFYLRPNVFLKVLKEVKNFNDFKHLSSIVIEHLKLK
tara:strand:+ start:1609 stop:3018 length:1410 start_codon:yes stop_codon:yes gene_type:complete